GSATVLLAWALASVGLTPVHAAASASARTIRSRGFVRVRQWEASSATARSAREEASPGGNRPPATPSAVTSGGSNSIGVCGLRIGSGRGTAPPRPPLRAGRPHTPPPPAPPRGALPPRGEGIHPAPAGRSGTP